MQDITQIVFTSFKNKDRLKKLIEENKRIILIREWESPSLQNVNEPRYTVEIKVKDGFDLFLLGFNLACEIVTPAVNI